MSLITNICKVMHIGDKNPNFKYMMHDLDLNNVEEEKTLA